MFWFKILSKLFKILHSNDTPKQIGWGFGLGAFVGFMPALSPQTLIFFLLAFLLNINIGIFFLGIALFKIIALFFDAPAHMIGNFLLVDFTALKPLWTKLYNIPIVPFTKFNHTVILGNLIIGLIILVPAAIFFKKFVIYYRANLMEKIQKFKLVKLLKGSKLYNLYNKIRLSE